MKTIVIGASSNPERYSYKAVLSLLRYNKEVIALGIKEGRIGSLDIEVNKPQITETDTITLYIGPQHQEQWYEYIFACKPKRVIFNPGTENYDFANQLKNKGIEVVFGCTLVMLASGEY